MQVKKYARRVATETKRLRFILYTCATPGGTEDLRGAVIDTNDRRAIQVLKVGLLLLRRASVRIGL